MSFHLYGCLLRALRAIILNFMALASLALRVTLLFCPVIYGRVVYHVNEVNIIDAHAICEKKYWDHGDFFELVEWYGVMEVFLFLWKSMRS